MAKVKLTPGRIESFTCDKGQVFLWDSSVPGLGVRATPGGKRAFILQSRIGTKAIRITLGDTGAIALSAARSEAKRLLLLLEQGIDPREQKRQLIADQEAARAEREQEDSAAKVREMQVAEIWREYIEERRPHWSERHYLDHVRLSQPGGDPVKRGQGVKKEGPLFAMLQLRMIDLSPAMVESWLTREARNRAAQARLAFGALKAFITWCASHPTYGAFAPTDIFSGRIRSVLPKKKAKADVLQREQLRPWFKAVRQLQNPVIASYLQVLLLTGARREEVAGLRWEDIDFRWKSLVIKDKVEGERIIPLTPGVESLLQFLPRRNQWVFSSPKAASGRIQEPRIAHNRALAVAGLEGLTLHGLRRSFGSLAEWCEMPVGVVAQIMGHKPSATAERHYRVRPLDLLRKWHTTLEAWVLDQAGIVVPVAENKQLSPILTVVNER